jgi:hypothetical protein
MYKDVDENVSRRTYTIIKALQFIYAHGLLLPYHKQFYLGEQPLCMCCRMATLPYPKYEIIDEIMEYPFDYVKEFLEIVLKYNKLKWKELK